MSNSAIPLSPEMAPSPTYCLQNSTYYNSQIYLRLLQHEEGCHPSFESRPIESYRVHARQFSSGDWKGSSVQPNLGTRTRVRAHSHTPSSSMSFPDIQNSVRLLLVRLFTNMATESAFSPSSKLINLAPNNSHIFLASIQPTRSLETK
jgi:hypothetical protein